MKLPRRSILKLFGISAGHMSPAPVVDTAAEMLAALPVDRKPVELFTELTDAILSAKHHALSLSRVDFSTLAEITEGLEDAPEILQRVASISPPTTIQFIEGLASVYRQWAHIKALEASDALQPMADRVNHFIDTHREQLTSTKITEHLYRLSPQQMRDCMTLKVMNPDMQHVTVDMMMEYFEAMLQEEVRHILELVTKAIGSERARILDENAQHTLPKEVRTHIAQKKEEYRIAMEEHERSQQEHPLVTSFRDRFATDLEERGELAR